MPNREHILSIDEDKNIVRVLRFMREYMRLSTRDVAKIMEGEFHSRSLIAAIENGSRNPNTDFVVNYAMAIQKRAGLKGILLVTIQKCIEDEDFLEELKKYEMNDFSFRTIYLISKKIVETSENQGGEKNET